MLYSKLGELNVYLLMYILIARQGMPEVWCWYKNVYGRNRSSWSAVRVDAGKHVDFCRGFVLSTAERSRVTYLKSDKAYGCAAISQGDVGTRWKSTV